MQMHVQATQLQTSKMPCALPLSLYQPWMLIAEQTALHVCETVSMMVVGACDVGRVCCRLLLLRHLRYPACSASPHIRLATRFSNCQHNQHNPQCNRSAQAQHVALDRVVTTPAGTHDKLAHRPGGNCQQHHH